MPDIAPSPLLRRALLADALGSLPVAALHLMATAPLAAATQLPAALLGASGAVMAAYVASLLVMAGRTRLQRWLVQAVVVGNAGWALAALALGLWLWPAAAGWALLALHAAWVLAFAALQAIGLRRSAPAAGHNGPLDHPLPRTP